MKLQESLRACARSKTGGKTTGAPTATARTIATKTERKIKNEMKTNRAKMRTFTGLPTAAARRTKTEHKIKTEMKTENKIRILK